MAKSELGHERPSVVRGSRCSGKEAVSGVVHVIREEKELERFREGEILVAVEVPDEWSHLFALAKAIITQTDVIPAQILAAAETYSLPVTTGVQKVTSYLRSGDIVMMDIDGTIQRLEERRAPDSKMRVSVPAAVHARQFACSEADSANGDVVSISAFTKTTSGDTEPETLLLDDEKTKKIG